MPEFQMNPTPCAITERFGDADELYPANFGSEALNPRVFSARRLPDRIHYRLVRSRTSGLVRSDPVADPSLIAQLYQRSTFDYGSEVPNLVRTYGRYVTRLERCGITKRRFCEIGCGNGFMLSEALRQGYNDVIGVEPSRDAVAKAPAEVAGKIICDFLRPGLFPENHFSVICFFQVFDHLPEPNEILRECFRILEPNGVVLCYNHNIESLSSRILGERSPIIDIEHTYLYSPSTLSALFRKHGYHILESGVGWNDYSLNYLARLVPLPNPIKRILLSLLRLTDAGRVILRVPLGNLYLYARKPMGNAAN